MPDGTANNYLKPAGKPYRGTNKAKRKARLRTKSKKQRELDKVYSMLRREFLAGRVICEKWLLEHGWDKDPDENHCYRHSILRWIKTATMLLYEGAPRSDEVHHGRGRGRFMLDVSTWHALSRKAHVWVHDNPAEAEKIGLLHPSRNRRPI